MARRWKLRSQGLLRLRDADEIHATGHRVSLYERYDFSGEVGASLSCAKNGTMWLDEWKVNSVQLRIVVREC